MGEVYRADDLVLGTSVALKFLPLALAGDPVRFERLRNEVRIARQVAHPNVCRVYDIGEADGRPFLSMEYIDGEDLASLLRRIGRLPKDKAVELAREICAGVAAAHELGVIHRDLKPANVMIDGRGRARVADFGLASAIGDLSHGHDAIAGTPIYMAPEQLAGSGATKQTDIYALGLVLYELFTGKRAHDAKSLLELKEQLSSSAPPISPSELVDGMDLRAEQVIMRCLAPDPDDRPASALAVMAALPGGDPLAAMLKAGEMPSPELVAASGRTGTLSRPWAIRLAAVALLCMAAGLWFFGHPSLGDAVGGILPPEVLSHRAETALAELGHEIESVDSAWGHDLDWEMAPRLASMPVAERRELFLSDVKPILTFWYRSSPEPMNPWYVSLPGNFIGNVVTPVDPPLTTPGMTFVRLGPQGNLLGYRVVSSPSDPLDLGPAPTTTANDGGQPADRIIVYFFAFFAGGALLAAHNVRRGQWDRRGASRLAAAAFILCFAGDFVGSHHSLDPAAEVHAFFASTAYGATRGLMTWILYIAIEPFIRKLHPRSLVSWSRLLAGRVTDPAVGRDVLVGLTVSAVQLAVLGSWFAGRGLQGAVPPYWAFLNGDSPLDTFNSLGMTFRMPVVSLGSALGFLLVYVVVRRLCGRFARAAAFLLWTALFGFSTTAYLSGLETIDIVAFATTIATAGTYLAVRHGLLAFTVANNVGNTLMFTVLTLDPTDWYFPPTAIFVVVFIGLTVFGVRVSADRSTLT